MNAVKKQHVRQSLLLFFISITNVALTQYYLRGELKDEQGKGLANVRIVLHSKGNHPFYTGSSGAFGIPSGLKVDTVTLYASGYDTLKTAVVTTEFANLVLKAERNTSKQNTLHLHSFTKNLNTVYTEPLNKDGETYTSTVENQFVNTSQYPETGLSLNIDKASYSNIRRFIVAKEKPPPDAVRIEEMLNYFNFRPKIINQPDKVFAFTSNVTSCPWNTVNRLLFVNLQARKINLDKTPPANFVFLIDVSGSMDMPNRLPLLKSAFKLLAENLRSIDIVSMVTYGEKVSIPLHATRGDHKQKIIEAIEGLSPSGSTPGASAIRTAYKIARNNFLTEGNNRVILATDGDFNVGQTSEKDLETIISQERKSGIYLSCLGVGMGNYKDSKLEALAKAGNGNFAYLDTEKEAEKVLVEEFAQTMYTVANNVYLTVNFNPAAVKEYRLIGFDNKKTAIADKTTRLEGGEIGSGQSLLAVFEFTPADLNIPAVHFNSSPIIASVQLAYHSPESTETTKERFTLPNNYVDIQNADKCLRFASAIILFGSILKQSSYCSNYSWEDLYSLASTSIESGNLLQGEFIDLVTKARKMYPNVKKKKL